MRMLVGLVLLAACMAGVSHAEKYKNATLPKEMTGLWCVSYSRKVPGGKDTNLSSWVRSDRRGKPCRQDGDTEWIHGFKDGSYSGSEYECRAVRVAGEKNAYSLTLRCDGEESTWNEEQKLELVDGGLRSVRTTTNLRLSR